LLVTDRGEIRVFDVDIADADQPVKDAAAMSKMYDQPVIGYPLTDASSLWVADNRLTNYKIQVTTAQINREPAITHVGDTFVAPLQLFQDVLVHVRRVQRSAGVTVAGVQIDNLRKPLWETRIGVPLGEVVLDSEKNEFLAVTAAAELFDVNRQALEEGIVNEPQANAAIGGIPLAFTDALPLADRRVAVFNPDDYSTWLHLDPAGETRRLRLVKSAVKPVQASCRPVAFQNGVLLPCVDGRVLLLDPAKGEQQTLPFQPRLQPGEEVVWRRPAVIGGGGDFVIADDQRRVYRVGIKPQPQPFLGELQQKQLDLSITSDLATVGDTIYGVAQDGGKNVLLALDPAKLEPAGQWDLEGGRITWGPRCVGDMVLVVINARRMYGFDAGREPLWSEAVDIPGQPLSDPLIRNGEFIFASADGTVWSVSEESGEVAKRLSVGEPLVTGPAAIGKQLMVGGEGTLYIIPPPADPS
jgi:hypothetical protein